ncbi:hypothetical protein [Peribacillus simplex]|uniref:hypothetical protein n=1 Tax=Peribacillus simplex TaxID=1478 RepID=UPI003D2A4041
MTKKQIRIEITHGGMIATLIDPRMGALQTQQFQKSTVTTDIQVRYVKPLLVID